MRHRVAGRQLSRNSAHRKALRRNLASSLIQHGAIKTTEAKAKELRRFVEKLITTARKGTLHARRRVTSLLQDREQILVHSGGQNPDEDIEELGQTVVEKLFSEIAPRYQDRPGGYTRIIRLPDRRIGDGGKQVIIQLVGEGSESEGGSVTGRRGEKAARRHDAVEQALGGDSDETPTTEDTEVDNDGETAAEEAPAIDDAETGEEPVAEEEPAVDEADAEEEPSDDSDQEPVAEEEPGSDEVEAGSDEEEKE